LSSPEFVKAWQSDGREGLGSVVGRISGKKCVLSFEQKRVGMMDSDSGDDVMIGILVLAC